jgi:TM2 domain-containing membrane protein YozV
MEGLPMSADKAKLPSTSEPKPAAKPVPVAAARARVPISKWLPVVFLAWLIPGAGHLYLKRPYRAALTGGSTLLCFLFGVMMEGAFFAPKTGELLVTLINVGGYVADVLNGLPYLLAIWLKNSWPDVAGHVHDYGTKFMVASGLLNLLAMVDAWEIATGEKD